MNVFSHKSDISHIQNDLEFNASLDEVLEDYYLRQPPYAQYTQGRSITTCLDWRVVYEIKKFDLILRWLDQSLLRFFHQQGIDNFGYQITRSWCNRIYHGVSGKVHNHWCGVDNSLNMILYYQTPPGSSKYVIINHEQVRERYTDYDTNDLVFFEVQPGLAICHASKVYHDVTEHQNHEPRTVFVFDIIYEI